MKRPDEGWFEFIRHSKSAELPVVLLEDIGALVGLILALVGVILSGVTDEPRFDAIGSISIGLLLVVISFVLASEMRSLLVGEAAGPEDVAAVRKVLHDDPRVVRVRNVRTQHLGPQELLVGADLELIPRSMAMPSGTPSRISRSRSSASSPRPRSSTSSRTPPTPSVLTSSARCVGSGSSRSA